MIIEFDVTMDNQQPRPEFVIRHNPGRRSQTKMAVGNSYAVTRTIDSYLRYSRADCTNIHESQSDSQF